MVSFGRRSNKLETLSRPSKYRSSPIEVPGNLYTNRRPEPEVDADGDLDDLIQQEIQRYEELFHGGPNDVSALEDDDTLQDGSIYTSMQASTMLSPVVHHTTAPTPPAPQHEDEDVSMWGLENPPPIQTPLQVAPTSFLTSNEIAAARACQITKPKSSRQSFVPPVAAIPLDEAKNKSKAAPVEVKKSSISPVTSKKTKFKVFPKRLLGKGNASNKESSNVGGVSSTPQTQASTPAGSAAPKIKFFSPVKFLKPAKSFKQQNNRQYHQNLLLASMMTRKQNEAETKLALDAAIPTTIQVEKEPEPSVPPSPPPPIETCEFRFGDGASVGSAQSSLTDALDAWFVKNSPPKIIGGNHVHEISPYKMEAYEGGLTPYHDPNKPTKNDEQGSTGSPGALMLTDQGLFFHNHGKPVSPVRPVHSSEEPEGDPTENQEQEAGEDKAQPDPVRDSNECTTNDATPEGDMQVGSSLGVQDAGPSPSDQSNNVKRDLFGVKRELAEETDSSPLQQVASTQEDDAGDGPVSPQGDDKGDAPKSPRWSLKASDDCANKANPKVSPRSQKPSKFKKFLSKLVNPPIKIKQSQQELRSKEQERVKSEEAEAERQRREQEELTKLEERRLQELESSDPASNTGSTTNGSDAQSDDECRPRSFSLMSGQMKEADLPSQSSVTADVTSFPTVPSAPSSGRSLLETPRQMSSLGEGSFVPGTPSSSYLVNFQFHRQDGAKTYTMAYSVDSSTNEDIKWKDIVNQAWKEDRRVVRSGVFSAITADSIAKIQLGQLEMRFELPFWGKHASVQLGPKTLDLLLDVVGPQRPVQVTISLEEPQVAAGVEDDGAPECLF